MKTTTVYGDRWDILSYDFTPSAGNITQMMLANPALAEQADPILPEGIEISIPEVSSVPEVEIVNVSAPWKR